MEKTAIVKNEIALLISQTFGVTTAHTFKEAYAEATLPIYTEGAMKILSDFLGKEKAQERLHGIFAKYNIQQQYV